jgi:hypothetical protein
MDSVWNKVQASQAAPNAATASQEQAQTASLQTSILATSPDQMASLLSSGTYSLTDPAVQSVFQNNPQYAQQVFQAQNAKTTTDSLNDNITSNAASFSSASTVDANKSLSSQAKSANVVNVNNPLFKPMIDTANLAIQMSNNISQKYGSTDWGKLYEQIVDTPENKALNQKLVENTQQIAELTTQQANMENDVRAKLV